MKSKRPPGIFPFYALLLTSAVVVSSIYAVAFFEAANLSLYFGSVPPVPAALIICLVGLAALWALQAHLEFSVCVPSAFGRGFPLAAVLVVPFAVVATISDFVAPFPADINVSLPTALAFYPAIGYIAQFALHIIPFALVMAIGEIFLGKIKRNLRLCLATILASTLEPVFQVVSSTSNDRSMLATAVMASSLFLFGVVELQLYRRFDYATMFAFRLLYYAYWHVVWGTLRLHWLF